MLVRAVSSKAKNLEKENVILADALNLLSPKDKYRPSLLANLTKGSAHEQYKADDVLNIKMPSNVTSTNNKEVYLKNLFFGLSELLANKKNEVLQMNDRELHVYAKTLTSEAKIFETIQLLQYQGRLTPRLLMELTLNRHLVNLARCPINLMEIEKVDLSWKNPLFNVHYNIILLKKFQDLKKPLMVIKNLKQNFDKYYLPLIIEGKLSPFYERIVWKFYFEYIKQYNEVYYIDSLKSLKSAFLIWESSPALHNGDIAKHLAQSNMLNELQSIFFRICADERTQACITEEMEQGNSTLLSNLKQVSIKYKIYDMAEVPVDESSRLVYYSLINSLENIVSNRMALDSPSKMALLAEMKRYKEERLMNMNTSEQTFSMRSMFSFGRN